MDEQLKNEIEKIRDEILEKEGHWTLDKRIPIGLIVAFLIQAAVSGWAVRGAYDEIGAVRVSVTEVESDIDRELSVIREDTQELKRTQVNTLREFNEALRIISAMEAHLQHVNENLRDIKEELTGHAKGGA